MPSQKRAMRKASVRAASGRSHLPFLLPASHINPPHTPHTRTASNQSTPKSVRVEKLEPRPNDDVSAQRAAPLQVGFGFGGLEC